MAKPRGKVSFSDQSPEFFKVYIPDFSYQHLRIPPAFVKEFSGNIPNNAILRDIRGKYCHVELKEVEKDLFIKNGWQEFVRGHSVAEGDFLVFRYHGKALFDVRIFGRNGCRRDESSAIDETAICVKKEEETEEETEEELTKPPHGYKQLQLEFGVDRTENSGSMEVGRCKSRRIAAMNAVKRMRPEAASFVKPKNPHFITLIGRSSQYNLYIPQHVLRKNNIKLEREIVMRDQRGNLWPMRVNTRKDGRFSLVKGWAKFWKESNLGRWDQCVFEFIVGRGRISREIHVQVIHASKMAKNPRRR